MHITKIELENIKSHAHFEQEFQRGTTAITGENGAGKTTLIEAVAWTLFDLLDYKKDDFLRRGTKKGTARVTFESDKDEREYMVYRDTGTGYYIYDPKLKVRTHEKKEEVTRFLLEHLGVEAGTDLEALFRRAIGVPQGTFTAIFLETATERKKAFDKLLKVEEYRQGAEKLRETVRFVEQKINNIREKIARSEGELARFEQFEEERKNFEIQAVELSKTLENLEKETIKKRELVAKLDEMAVDTKENQIKNLDEQMNRLRENLLVNRERIKEAEAKSAKAKEVENLQKRDLEIAKNVTRLRARLEVDEQFQREVKNGLCPILSQKCLNLKPGETLEGFLHNQFAELKSGIKDLETEQRNLAGALRIAREAERFFATLETLRMREKEIVEEGKGLKQEKEILERDFLAASKDYDREQHQKEKLALLEAERRMAETRANLKNAQKRADESALEIKRLEEVRKQMQVEFREKERLEKVAEATEFIRSTLKEAAPLVARNYVYHVSFEANQMYREIFGNAECSLIWSEDYGIDLEENGYDRPFLSLSGGEQMAAALSVRLALLKQLSDIRIAFFDEPTANMDAERRERLAEQISQITEKQTFDQLFVISHDDTFESYVDNVVSVGNEK